MARLSYKTALRAKGIKPIPAAHILRSSLRVAGDHITHEEGRGMTLEEKVRAQIGDEALQLTTEEYENRIDDLLKHMCAGELLARISIALEDDQ